jgi:hypothetical protein
LQVILQSFTIFLFDGFSVFNTPSDVTIADRVPKIPQAASKAIEVLLVNIKGNDTERFKTLSDALLLLENEG